LSLSVSFFLVLYGRTKSVRPYIEISIRLCHRSRLILPPIGSVFCVVFVRRFWFRPPYGRTDLSSVCDWNFETKLK
jgi:hypothetical protein